jgi:hypothetical protein
MSVEELINLITRAFHGVEQPPKITLYVAEAQDYYHYNNNDKHQKRDYMGPWENIPEEHIRDCRNALAYLDKVGMRYYLPAYMVWALKNIDDSEADTDYVLYSLDHFPKNHSLSEYHKERFSLFSPKQMEACALFLKFCAEDEFDRIDSYFAKKKYERYWFQFVDIK